MDIEKLIERLRSHRGALFEMLYKQDMDDAATALSVLQAENEKLRAELERVKRERDAVLNAFRGFIYGKSGLGVWAIMVEKQGTAPQILTECSDEDADIYSDVFEIDAEVRRHKVVEEMKNG